MAYAGTIVIKTGLDNKDFNKQLTALNKKLEKLKFDKIVSMRKEINKCKNVLISMVKNLRTFNSLSVDANKFSKLAENIKSMKINSNGLTKVFKNIADYVNTLDVNNIKILADSLKTINSMGSKVYKNTKNTGVLGMFSNIPNNIKSGLSFKDMQNLGNINSSELKGMYENAQKALTQTMTDLMTKIPNNIKSALSFKNMQNLGNINSSELKDMYENAQKAMTETLKDLMTKVPNNIKSGLSLKDLQNLGSANSSGLGLSQSQQMIQVLMNNRQQISAIMAGIAGIFKNAFRNITSIFKKGLSTFKSLSSRMINQTKQMREKMQSNFTKLTKSFKSFMFALGVDFSFTGLVRGIKSTISEMQSLQTATVGLYKILGKKENIDNAMKFIHEYIDDGLVSMQDAIIQYKNYTLKGYGHDEVVEMMNAAKDVASVSRKAGIDLGTSLVNLSEGVRLELSRLMDASGLSKNLQNILRDYAHKIGKESQTDLNDREALLAVKDYFKEQGILFEGMAEKISKTFIGTTQRLQSKTKMLFAEIGNTIAFVFKPILKDITKIIEEWTEKIVEFNQKINRVVENINNKATNLSLGLSRLMESKNSLFGISKEDMDKFKQDKNTILEGVQDLRSEESTGSEAGVISTLTDDMEDLEDATKKVLAPFDTLNQLSFDKNVGATEETDETAIKSEDTEEEVKETVYWLDYLKLYFKNFIDSLGLDTNKIKKSWGELLKKIFGEDVSLGVFETFDKFLNTIIGPAIKWLTEEGLPVLIDTIGIVVQSFKDAGIDFEPLKNALSGFWDTIWGDGGENFKKTISFLFNEIIVPFLKWVIEWALPWIIQLLDRVIKFVQEYGPIIVALIKVIWEWLEPKLDWLLQKIIDIFDWLNGLDDIGKVLVTVGGIIGGILVAAFISLLGIIGKIGILLLKTLGPEVLMSLVGKIGPWITGTLWPAILTGLKAVGGFILKALGTALGTIAAAILAFIGGFKLGEYIAENWMSEEALKDFYWGVMTAIDTVKTWFLNLIMDIVDGWNAMIDWFKELPGKIKEFIDKVGEFIGKVIDAAKDKFRDFIENIKDKFTTVTDWFSEIPDKIKDIFDNIKDWFKNFDLFEFLKDQIDNVGGWISDMWSKLWGNDTQPTSNPLDGYYSDVSPYSRSSYRVPAYATGAILPANHPHLAIVGDQKQGTNIETQISTMMEAFNRVLQQSNMGGGAVIQNVLKVDGQVLYTSNNKVSRQRGNRMISR